MVEGLALIADLHPEFTVYTVSSWEKVVQENHIYDDVYQSWGGVIEGISTQELKSNVPKIQGLEIINSHWSLS